MFTIKQGDTRPAYVVDLIDDYKLPTEKPLNLTSATTVYFIMRAQGASVAPKVRTAMTVVDAAQGRVQHTWAVSDTDTIGQFDVEFEINWSDGGIETVPNGHGGEDPFLVVNVTPDLD